MFLQKFQQFVDDQHVHERALMIEADRQIENLQSALNSTRDELAQLKSAKCPKCGNSLPADGKCQACLAKAMPKTADNAFIAGAISLALVIGDCRKRGVFVDNFDLMKIAIDETVRQRNNVDREAARLAVIDRLYGLIQQGCSCTTPAAHANFFDDLQREYVR